MDMYERRTIDASIARIRRFAHADLEDESDIGKSIQRQRLDNAMTEGGANIAPNSNQADIGVAMETQGAEADTCASDLNLRDDKVWFQ